MDYIPRDIEPTLRSVGLEYAAILLIGPRQVGKTTTLLHVFGREHNYVTLDDLSERKIAKEDPALFFQLHKPPVLVDEVQYAPELFSAVKIAVDAGAPAGSFLMTGSQAFHLMELAQESLAGRVAMMHMSALSQHELHRTNKNDLNALDIDSEVAIHFDLERLIYRASRMEFTDLGGLYERIFLGGLPELASGAKSHRDLFYASYLETYISRDITAMVPGLNILTFNDFIKACACRVGQVLNVHSIASDVGISDNTAKSWLGLLEKSNVVFFLRPYSNNLLKRSITKPKLYFFDTGLVAYLTSYTSAQTLSVGALAGAILENYVVNQFRSSFANRAMLPAMHYYRDRDGREIDILMEGDGVLHPVEVKRSVNPSPSAVRAFGVLENAALEVGCGMVACARDTVGALSSEVALAPIWAL